MNRRLFTLTFCILSAFVFCNAANAQKGTKPTLAFHISLPENEAAEGQAELRVFLNERLVNTHTWKADKGCVPADVIASLPRELSQLKSVDLLALVAEEVVAFDSLPWDKMRDSFESFDLYANGRRVYHVSFSEDSRETTADLGSDNPTDPNPQPNPDCTPHVGAPSISCTPWVAGAPVSHSYSNPCLLGMNCETPIWGTQTCTVTVTTSTRSCTTSTTTTWTPNTPGVTCPGPSTVTSTSTQSTTFTSAPACGTCS